jgi:NADH-quinone oxidoreductase subunit K
MAESVFFWTCAIGASVSALAVVYPPIPGDRGPGRSAAALVACLTFVTGQYLLLAAHLLAVAQLLFFVVGVGALFVVATTRLDTGPRPEVEARSWTLARIFTAAIVVHFGVELTLAMGDLALGDPGALGADAERAPGLPYVGLGAVLFSVGALGVLLRRNLLVVLMCLALMLNAVGLTVIAFGRAHAYGGDGHPGGGASDGWALGALVMVIAVAEAAVGLSIVGHLFRGRQTLSVDAAGLMRR